MALSGIIYLRQPKRGLEFERRPFHQCQTCSCVSKRAATSLRLMC